MTPTGRLRIGRKCFSSVLRPKKGAPDEEIGSSFISFRDAYTSLVLVGAWPTGRQALGLAKLGTWTATRVE